MRFERVLVCILLLAATALAQGPSETSTPASGQEQTQQQPSQQPENPLQDTPKVSETTAAPQQKPTFDVTNSAGSAQDQVLGEVRLMTRYTELHGDESRSFKVQGVNNLGEMNFFQDRRFLVTRRMQVLSMYRGTDDRSIDPEHNSLQKAYLRIYGPSDEYIFGDALVNYSRLSFNQNIKGVSVAGRVSDSWKISSVAGVFTDRYGSLFKQLAGEPYTAVVSGVRLEHGVARDSTLGFNFSSSNDLRRTLPTATVGTFPLPGRNHVTSIDTKLQWVGIRLEGEFGYSFSDFDTRSDICLATCDSRFPQPELGTQSDWGTRIDGSLRRGKVSVRGSFLRFQPNFASVNARQVADLQDWVVRTSVEATDWLTLEGTLRRSNNDLKDHLDFQTRLWGPEVRFILHDLSFYRRAVFEIGYRHRDVLGEGPGTVAGCQPNSGGGSLCVDRFVRMPFVEVTLPVGGTFLNFGYENRRAADAIVAAQGSNTHRVYAGWRGVYSAANWQINPVLRFELERRAHRPELPLVTRLDYDSNRLGSVMLFIEAPRWFILEGAYRNSTATIFGPRGYARPTYRAAISYKIRNDENMMAIFSFERNNNFFFPPQEDFDERQVAFTLLYKFGTRR